MRPYALALLLAVPALPAAAATPGETARLAEALGMSEIIAIMREEGLLYAEDLREELFPGRGGAGWTATVDAIYDAAAMEETVVATMADSLADTDVGPLLDFFTSERGREIIAYEVSARAALMDEDIEDAAEARLESMRAEDDPALEPIARFVEVNDLVESNVMGAMNANYAFYRALADAGGFGGAMTESEILADVWAQEDAIRADTDLWVHAYLAMAYRPLASEDLEAYIALSETEAGQALNRALFDGFDVMYVEISRALGIAAARMMAGEDI